MTVSSPAPAGGERHAPHFTTDGPGWRSDSGRRKHMRPMLRWTLLSLPALLAASSSSAGQTEGPLGLRKVIVGDGVELHYVERGKGVPVLFVHGTLGDYSTWDGQLGSFAQTYHAVAYSRRYNYPNTNKLRPKHSAVVEAEDLAALIKKLDLGKVHIVGHSYGGYTALFLAVKHPELVRTLTLAEPPIVIAGGRVEDARERVRSEERRVGEGVWR